MKGIRSMLWIDWKLAGGLVARRSASRFLFLFVLAFGLLALLLSAGIGRFLSSQYAITVVLRASVSAEDAEGLARKAAELGPVALATYRSPAEAWKEFVEAFPGLEPIAESGGNPLPGYIRIRIRSDRFTPADLEQVISALRPLPAVDKVLAGEESLPRLFMASRYASILAWAVFGAFLAAFFAVCRLQEQVAAHVSRGGFRFLLERGVAARRIAAVRAAGAGLWCLLLAACATGTAAAVLARVLGRFAPLATVVGPPEDLLTPRVAAGAGAFVLLAALLCVAASLLGWRTIGASRK